MSTVITMLSDMWIKLTLQQRQQFSKFFIHVGANLQPFFIVLAVFFALFVCLVGFLTSSSTTRLYCGRAPRQSVWQFYVLPHMRQSWETMTSVSAGHIILTPTQPVGSGRPQRGSNPGPAHQESRALPTELPRPPYFLLNAVNWCDAVGRIVYDIIA